MAASKRQMNWSAVAATLTGGSATNITGVTEIQVDPGGTLVKFQGDTDKYPTTIVQGTTEPKVSITTADVATAQGFAVGSVYAIGATFKDAKLATGGDIVYAISNAVFENAAGGGSHQEFGSVTATWQCYSSDGTTNPVAFTRA